MRNDFYLMNLVFHGRDMTSVLMAMPVEPIDDFKKKFVSLLPWSDGDEAMESMLTGLKRSLTIPEDWYPDSFLEFSQDFSGKGDYVRMSTLVFKTSERVKKRVSEHVVSGFVDEIRSRLKDVFGANALWVSPVMHGERNGTLSDLCAKMFAETEASSLMNKSSQPSVSRREGKGL